MDRTGVAAAMRQAGLTVEDSPNVLGGRNGSASVYGILATRGWRLQDAPRYPLRQAVVRRPEQVSEFCHRVAAPAAAEPAPVYFDGEFAFRLDQEGGCA